MMSLKSDPQPNQMKYTQDVWSKSLKSSNKDLIQVKDYVFHANSIIGKGKMSVVYKAVDLKSNQVVAIKKISKKTLNSEYLVTSLLNEISIHNKVKHANIVGLKEVIRSTNSIYLVLEYCNRGTLRDYLKEQGKMTEKEAKQILIQIIQGMDQLLQNNILHRDIKPENILCHEDKNGLSFKICDFGFSKKLAGKDELLQSAIGSPQYMDLQRLSSEGYSTKSDVFSLGIITYEMVFGRPPWLASNWHDLKCDLMSKPLKVPENVVSREMEVFLKKTLAIWENERASWDDLRKCSIYWTI